MTLRIPCKAVSAGLLLLWGATSASAGGLIAVENDHPDLTQMRSARSAAPVPGLAAAERSKVDKLKLPLLLPDPVAAPRALGATAAPKPNIMSDDSEPVWYHSETDFGGVLIEVEADLRTQHEFPGSYPVYEDTARAAGAQGADPVHGEHRHEEGMANQVGQVTVTRYGVPYTITVTCEQADSEKCKAAEKMARDGSLLKLMAAPKAD